MSDVDLHALGEQERQRQAVFATRVFCCTSTACMSSGAGPTREACERALAAIGLPDDEAEIVPTGCMGLCSAGPLVRVDTRDGTETLYRGVKPEVGEQIVQHHLDPKVDHSAALEPHLLPADAPFYAKQVKVVLQEAGHINPEKLEDYLAHGGYRALEKVLQTMSPEQVCDEVFNSGLRGRGGAGYRTGLKWRQVRAEQNAVKYVIVNGDEGDPGAYMDRTVMEDEPHRVLEGLIIAAYAVGATFGYVYVRGEYPVAVQRMRRAIRAARRRGLLGKSIMGTEFAFDADVRIGAGAFVCGEETALMHSIEGKRGMPRMRPPYPSTSGLWGKPTLINNVETMANIPSVILLGAEAFASTGTEKSKGTKVFALAGQLRNTGLIEVPMGITLREIVYDIGGGIPGDRAFKAVQTGGPSGGCIPVEYLDTPVDYESLTRLGSIMGSGGLIVVDETSSMPEVARFFMEFCMDESCGKCVPCRVGTVQIYKLLDKIIEGHGTLEDLDRLEKLCMMVKTTSLCGLGQSAPNPVLSTLKYFRHEYEALVSASDSPEAAAD